MRWLKALTRGSSGGSLKQSKWFGSLAGLAVVLAAGGVFSHVQSVRAAEQYTQQQMADEFTNEVNHEAALMHTFLKTALHEPMPCDGACNRDEDFARVVQTLIMRCDRFDPAAWEQSPLYDAKRNGRALVQLKAACGTLHDAVARYGQPTENADWINAVTPAKHALER